MLLVLLEDNQETANGQLDEFIVLQDVLLGRVHFVKARVSNSDEFLGGFRQIMDLELVVGVPVC